MELVDLMLTDARRMYEQVMSAGAALRRPDSMASSNAPAPQRPEKEHHLDERIGEIFAIVSELHRQLGANQAREGTPQSWEAAGTFLGYQPHAPGVFHAAPPYGTQVPLPLDFGLVRTVMPFGYPTIPLRTETPPARFHYK